jgi:cytochrome c556
MRRFGSFTIVLILAWAFSVAVAAQKRFTAEDLDKLMKRDGPTQAALVKALTSNNQAAAKTAVAQLKSALTESQEFWVENKRPDAIQFGKTVLAKLDDLDKIVNAPQMNTAAGLNGVRDLATACNACHKVYRITDENGQFTLKPGSIPGL